MANLKIKVLALSATLSFTPITDENPYVRETENLRNYNLEYHNGSGQIINKDSVLFTYNQNGTSFTVVSNDNYILSDHGQISVSVVGIPNNIENNSNILSFYIHNALAKIIINFNSLPTTNDIYINLNNANGNHHVFTPEDFLSKYSDYDNDPLTKVIIKPTKEYLDKINNTHGVFFNNELVTSPTIITLNDISLGKLTASSMEINAINTLVLDWDYYL